MISTVFAALLDRLQADATLLGYLGGAYIFRAKNVAPSQVPSITVFENTEKSNPRVGYCAFKKRDNASTVQIDIWVSSENDGFPCTGEDTDLIAERIDALLLDATSEVSGTRAGTWVKATSSQQYEDDTALWHNALRYSFEYVITDS